ncbi:hypothetical protein EU642_22130 [Salmonella enterica]|nr:hypothetical protein [Salmonella enterica]EAO0118553.1 hypothetical protein [Salmonella enterica]EAO3601658.1 hypothetical protein [Salmonella enterica]EAR6391551.1 hypothetical protein [Salmonella enterica]EAV1285315.1 hypothetical protein [Salmonella enterica]
MAEPEVQKLTENVIRLQEKVSNLENLVRELVTKAEFTPVKLVVYGLAGTVLSSVLMALIATVVIRK